MTLLLAADKASYGTTNGTAAGTRVDCPVADATKKALPYYGADGTEFNGTLPTDAEIAQAIWEYANRTLTG